MRANLCFLKTVNVNLILTFENIPFKKDELA